MSRAAVPSLAERLDALGTAADLARDRLPDAVVDRAADTVRAAGERQALSAEHTVVGFFGATGSGKSSLFNALTGRELAGVAATRPTTSEPLAAVWGVGRGQGQDGEGGGAAALLDWLGVKRRHLLDDAPVLDGGRAGFLGLGHKAGADATGLILLDLPDIDSVQRSNREVTERLAGHVDVLVWVVDPEKYADAVIHRDFLATMASHAAVTLVLLNQVDRLSVRERDEVLASLRRMLSGHGMADVRVLPVSARTGEGLDEVGRQIAAIVEQRGAAAERLGADVTAQARALDTASGPGEPVEPTDDDARRLGRDLASAGGVPAVVRAVEGSYRLRSAKRTSWPVLRWMHSFRADPLRRLHLLPERAVARRDRDPVERDPALHRTSLPERTQTQRAVVEGAVRTLVTAASAGAPEPWAASVRRAGRDRLDDVPGAVDQSIARTELGAAQGSWWWPVLDVLQWLALATAVAGAGWLGVLALAAYLQVPLPPAPTVEGFPIPTLLLVGGLALGLLLALLAIPLTRVTAASRGKRARRRLEDATTQVGRELVVDPVRAEVERHREFRVALARAAGGGTRARSRR